ncbi:MAG: hypothetical protein QGM45_12130 [Anaerolineales bacterium]|nr:hypothetical protein [Anaerolineales bacterium]
MSLQELMAAFTKDAWAGAVLGAIASAVFSAAFFGVVSAWRWLVRRSPIRRLLGDLAVANEPVGVYVRSMFHADRLNKYVSPRPDYFPPHTSGQLEQWQNIPFVVASADHEASTDFLNALGQVGKKDRIEFLSVHDDWDRWDHHVVCVGGNFKAKKVRELCEPKYLQVDGRGAFVIVPTGAEYMSTGRTDYGVIYKTKNPQTGRTCLLVMGIGALGTEAAGHYLRTHAAELGHMVGGGAFVLVVTADLELGKESVRVLDLYPEPPWYRKALHPLTWHRVFRPSLAKAIESGS